jgi:hypothetical protein
VTQATHTRLLRWLWYSLYGIEVTRRYLRTPPPDSGIAGYMTPEMWKWYRETSRHNRTIDPRTPGQRRAENRAHIAAAAKRRAELTALGYVFPR